MSAFLKSGSLLLCICAGFFASCTPGERVEITESRFVNPDAPIPITDASTDERFAMMKPVKPDPKPAQGPAKNPFRWDTPAGWKEITPTRMRPINFTFGPDQNGQCYLSALPGAAGGLVANLNRWRGQMGQAEQSAEEMQTLPTVPFLDGTAPFMAIDGTFTGMGTAPAENYRMLGTIVSSQELTLFVKMVGPKDLVVQEEQHFKDFVSSLRISGQ